MRTFELGYSRADGLPLGLEGMRYADQDSQFFQEYQYIEVEFTPSCGSDQDGKS